MRESLDIIKEICNEYDIQIDIFLSTQGELVLKFYKYTEEVKEICSNAFTEKGPNVPFLSGKLQMGKYTAFVICPATANTTAKLAHGIADSLITNSAAQAMKVDIPVYIYPVDQSPGTVVTKLPDGSDLTIHIREVDIKNVHTLKDMQGICVLEQIDKLKDIIKKFL